MAFLTRDELLDVIDRVKDIPAIVEGKRDTIALKKLGFTAIHEIDRPLFEVVERMQNTKTVQILTDLDKEGKELYGKLAKDFAKFGIEVDNRLREALFKTQLSHIEGLDSYIERL